MLLHSQTSQRKTARPQMKQERVCLILEPRDDGRLCGPFDTTVDVSEWAWKAL